MGNSLVFNGINSSRYGVIISGGGTYATPERDVSVMTVPGRNGDLIIDNGRFNNIQITYTAGISKGFETKFLPFIRALKAVKGYARLVDSYHPDYYRLASFRSELVPDVGTIMRSGHFDLVFDCKPQRYLKSGDKEIELNWTDNPVVVGGTDWDGYSDLDSDAQAQVDELGLMDYSVEFPRFTLPRNTKYVVEKHPDNSRVWIFPNMHVLGSGEYGLQYGSYTSAGAIYHAAYGTSPFLSVWDDTEEIYTPSYFATKITNPTDYPAHPLIRIYFDPSANPARWRFDSAFGIDADNFVKYDYFTDHANTVRSDSTILIDCELFNAYSKDLTGTKVVNHNGGVTFEGQLTIPPGESVFRISNFRPVFDNVLKVTMTPRWWTL